MLQYRQEEPRLKTYLDALEKPLLPLGEDAAKEWRLEAEGHLLGLIAANEELGSTHEEAVTQALQQFGNTQRVGRGVAQELRRQKYRVPPEEMKRASLSSLPACAGLLGVTYLGTLYLSETTLRVHESIYFGVLSLFIVLPLYSGWVRGLLKDRRAIAIAHLICLSYGFFMGMLHATLFELLPNEEALRSFPALFGAGCFFLFALMGAQMRQRFDSRKRANI